MMEAAAAEQRPLPGEQEAPADLATCLKQPQLCGTRFKACIPRRHEDDFLRAIADVTDRIRVENWGEQEHGDALRARIRGAALQAAAPYMNMCAEQTEEEDNP